MKDYLRKNDKLMTSVLKVFSGKKIPQSVILNLGSEKYMVFVSKYIAKYIQCQHKTSNGPCLKCLNCTKIENENHPDVIYPERTGATLTYSVATIRKVRNDANILPNESSYKIYIFFNAELMQSSAQNALLKLLEEPPSYAVFLLFCNNLNTILETVKSRCQIFDLSCYKPDISNNKGKEPLSIILTNELIEILLYKTEYEALLWSSKLKNNKELFKNVVLNLVLNFKSAINFGFKLPNSEDTIMCFKFSKEISGKFSVNKLLYFFEILNDINFMLNRNVNFNLLVTYFVSSLF